MDVNSTWIDDGLIPIVSLVHILPKAIRGATEQNGYMQNESIVKMTCSEIKQQARIPVICVAVYCHIDGIKQGNSNSVSIVAEHNRPSSAVSFNRALNVHFVIDNVQFNRLPACIYFLMRNRFLSPLYSPLFVGRMPACTSVLFSIDATTPILVSGGTSPSGGLGPSQSHAAEVATLFQNGFRADYRRANISLFRPSARV